MANKLFEKVLKKGKDVDGTEKEALKGLFKHMGDSAKSAMGEGFEGKSKMKAVVAAKDPKGLATGLEKAKELVEGSDEESLESPEMESEELKDGEELDPKLDTPEEIDAEIKRLIELKKELEGKDSSSY